MLRLLRTAPQQEDFQRLVADLDAELWIRYPLIQQNFAPYNKLDENVRVVMAYWEDKPVGCGCFRPAEEKNTIEIKRMYVAPAARGNGIAKQVLRELEDWAKDEGFAKSKLETGFNQPEAICLYRRCNYEEIPNYPPYTHFAESLCMAKDLE